MVCGGGIALHQHAVDLAASQVARKCHADWTAAYDKDWDLLHADNIDYQVPYVNCQSTSVRAEADIAASQQANPLFDYLVGQGNQRDKGLRTANRNSVAVGMSEQIS
jgi:hypothetical protein